MLRPILAAVLLSTPAAAGQATLSWDANPEEARLLGALAALHDLRERLEEEGDDRATLRQWGRDHAAALSQSGGGNIAAVRQSGRGHVARLDQRGGGNAHLLVQAGRGARAHVRQEGGEAGVTLQLGW